MAKPTSSTTDEALLIQAEVHLTTEQQSEAVTSMRALVLACPNSPHLPLAQQWLGNLTGADKLPKAR